jgi:hypothetical protein
MHLPTDAAARKELPIATGVLDYFPLALAEVARVSKTGNDQHNPNQPLHWDRSKSSDESDALIRHFLERDKIDSDGTYHAAKMVWRGLAYLEKLLESKQTMDTASFNPGTWYPYIYLKGNSQLVRTETGGPLDGVRGTIPAGTTNYGTSNAPVWNEINNPLRPNPQERVGQGQR